MQPHITMHGRVDRRIPGLVSHRFQRHASGHSSSMASTVPRGGLGSRALSRALAFVETHLGDRFTLEELASAAAVSRFHFARMFRLSTGYSPMAFLLHARVEAARHLLVEGNRRIADIAATLGFCDQSHFTRTFRRVTGVAPRDFARRHADPVAGAVTQSNHTRVVATPWRGTTAANEELRSTAA